MISEIYSLYKKNFPDIVRSEETIKNILGDKGNHIIITKDGTTLTGVSVINNNAIYLLCVDSNFRNQGIGTKLLSQSEKYIASNGFNKVIIGAGKDYIMPGIPMNNGAHTFFKKHNYIHSWGDCGCFDMSQMLKDFDYAEHSIGDTINEITYRWAIINDIDNIVKCVSDAEEGFVHYYKNKSLYEKDTKTPVLIAEKDNEVFGALMVSIETEGKDMGSVSCPTTVHKYRNKGIATNMVKLGTKHLKDIGLSKSFLGYTYTYIVNMFGRAGYKVSMEYYMGEKAVENTQA